MAVSLSQQGTLPPSSISEKSFGTARRGFDQSEVRSYLATLAGEIERLQDRSRTLEHDLRQAQEATRVDPTMLDEETLTRVLGEETARVLRAARESAAEIKSKAEDNAARMLVEASDEAARLREEAETDAARRRSDATADAEAELAMAKQQGREMVNEARAYRERVLTELARRREMERAQIEQLIHGRDRLTQAFERARLVAVDVVSELTPIDEPDAYVNLSPTTGPVPVTVPNERRTAPSAAASPAVSNDAVANSALAAGERADAETPVDEAPAADDAETISDVAPSAAADVTESVTTDDLAEADEATVAEESEHDEIAIETDSAEADDAGDTTDSAEGVVDADPQHVVAEDAEVASAEAESTEVVATDDPENADRDVVVDLFARLRAGTSDVDSDEADADGSVEADLADTPAEPEADASSGSVSGDVFGDLAAGVVADEEISADDVAETEHEETLFERRDAEVTPLIVACAKKLKRVLADEQNEVLDRLRRKEPVESVDAIVSSADEQLVGYTDAIAEELLAAAHAGAASVKNGTVARLRKTAAADAVAAGDAVVEQWLIAPMRDRLERVVAESSGDNQSITKAVRSLYREWKTQRIDEHLDDIVRAAHGRGLLAALPKNAVVEWTLDPDHDACADCADNALAGGVKAGSEFPTGDVFAPAHPGCRCLLVPHDR